MNKILITHPGQQHSHQLALALYEHNLLMKYCAGTPVVCTNEKKPWYIPKKYSDRIKNVDIPKVFRSHPLMFQLLMKSIYLLPSVFSKSDCQYRVFHFFDAWIAKRLKKINPAIVIAYEDSAYKTFLEAKKLGIVCVLDAPSLHHKAGAKLMDVIKTPYLEKINKQKDLEVELADYILCCSPLAAESYIQNGVSPDKIFPILLGANLPDFKIDSKIHNDPLHFVFAGVLSDRKSIDLIASAFIRLHSEGHTYKVSFIGGYSDSKWLDLIKNIPNSSRVENLPQKDLYSEFSKADCLLLPSRFDSFGMVVAEAMACGIPAIVSTKTGAKAMIEMFPKTGWIIEPDKDELYSCILNLIINRDEVFSAKSLTKQAAKEFTWFAYRKRVFGVISNILSYKKNSY